MKPLTRQVLRRLIEIENGPCVSIYQPTHRAGSQTRQDPIRFRNLLDQVEQQLLDANMRSPDVQIVLERARTLQDDHDYWQHQAEGLAIFLADEVFEEYELPFDPGERAEVGRGFHVVPLLPLIHGDGRFYVLAVSQKRVRLFVGGRDGLVEASPPELQFGMDEALALDMERELQMHSHQVRPRSRAGTETGVYHGHEDIDFKKYVREFFQKLDQAVCDVLSGEQAPLVFAGVDYLFPLYREANGYPHLAQQNVEGNFDEATAEELHAPAWEIVSPMFDEDRQAALSRLHASMGTGNASSDFATLLPAAFNGRIDTLFLANGDPVWGRYDHGTGKLTTAEGPAADNEDLLNLLVVQTLRHGGRSFAVEYDEGVGESRVAALFRFPAVEPGARTP